MQTTAEQLQHWLAEPEGVRLEFKEAKQNYHFDKLVEYCVALANEGGGKMFLGVTPAPAPDRRHGSVRRAGAHGSRTAREAVASHSGGGGVNG